MNNSLTRERFREFAFGLGEYLNENHPGICFYVFGSGFQNVSYSPGDLDGGIVVPALITDKEQIRTISGQIARLAEEHSVSRDKIALNLIDVQSSEDGRFLSYDTSYTNYLRKKAEVLTKVNHLGFLNGINFRYGTLESAAFNFRKVRNHFLEHSCKTSGNDYNLDGIRKAVLISLELTESLPKKLLEIYDLRETDLPEVIDNKYEAVEKLGSILPCVDVSFFREIKRLKREDGLESVLPDPEQTFKIWSQMLTTFESLIKHYIETHLPREIIVKTKI